MTDRPIIFSGPMIRALLDGRKTQTRRLATSPLRRCEVGDRLWVRERTMVEEIVAALSGESLMLSYDADGARVGPAPLPARLNRAAVAVGKRLSMGCFREASRLTLIVEQVRFHRLQEISEDDAIAEGIVDDPEIGFHVPGVEHPNRDFPCLSRATARGMYAALWDTLHGSGEWLADPEIVALTFRVVRENIDRIAA